MVRYRSRLRHSEPAISSDLRAGVEWISHPLRSPADLDPLLSRIGNAHYVLLGEASHGTHEYYTWRDEISRRLIVEKGFSFIAVEGDWPDCYRVNRYVKGYPQSGETAREVLHNFERWPTWMWANHEIVQLAEWLRDHNSTQPEARRIGFFGLDVYSLWDSMYRVMGYLGAKDERALQAMQRAYRCFEPYGEDAHRYASATRWVDASCEDDVIELLSQVQRFGRQFPDDGNDSRFDAEQNAWVVKNAEHYYRTMIRGGSESWNIRNRHMCDTLDRLMQHHGPKAKAIVWEHNTHIGDARHTDMAEAGMFNIGQLARERHGDDDVVLVGFGSYGGSVIAGQEWEAPMEKMTVPDARRGSWEDVLHQLDGQDRLLVFEGAASSRALLEPRGHRAIGVVYHPENEHYGNYVPTVLPRRYDVFLFIDRTEALRPLREVKPVDVAEVPETYPSGV